MFMLLLLLLMAVHSDSCSFSLYTDWYMNTIRILYYCREALMSGNDNSVITEHSFVVVCRKYGLVKLVRLRERKMSTIILACLTMVLLPPVLIFL